MGGGTRLEDVKEHIYKVCEPCYGKRKTLGIVLGLLMIPIAGYGIYSIWNSKTYDTGIPVLELGLMFGFMLLGWVLLSKVSGLTKLKRLALKERNIPGYSAMPKGQYDAFCKAASWNK